MNKSDIAIKAKAMLAASRMALAASWRWIWSSRPVCRLRLRMKAFWTDPAQMYWPGFVPLHDLSAGEVQAILAEQYGPAASPVELPMFVVSSCPTCGAPIYGPRLLLAAIGRPPAFTCDCRITCGARTT